MIKRIRTTPLTIQKRLASNVPPPYNPWDTISRAFSATPFLRAGADPNKPQDLADDAARRAQTKRDQQKFYQQQAQQAGEEARKADEESQYYKKAAAIGGTTTCFGGGSVTLYWLYEQNKKLREELDDANQKLKMHGSDLHDTKLALSKTIQSSNDVRREILQKLHAMTQIQDPKEFSAAILKLIEFIASSSPEKGLKPAEARAVDKAHAYKQNVDTKTRNQYFLLVLAMIILACCGGIYFSTPKPSHSSSPKR